MQSKRSGGLSYRACARIFMLAMIATLAGAFASGCNCSCTLEEHEETTTGYASEPHMVSNGTSYGIIYYWSAQAGGWPEIRGLVVSGDGVILKSKTGLGSVNHLYTPNYLSNLVWNGDNQQYAFAYTKDKALNFIRLDANLNPIGSPLVIKFPGLILAENEHPTLTYPSLVWNDVLNEYGLVYVTVEHPYFQDRHDDIYISRISPSGTYVGAYERAHIVNCPGDGEYPSLTYNATTGQYVLAYVKHDFPQHHIMVGFLTLPYTVAEHEIMAGWNINTSPQGVKILFDPGEGHYFVAASKGAFGSQIVDGSGNPVGGYAVKPNQSYTGYFSIDYITNHAYLIYAQTTGGKIGGWMVTESGHGNDLTTISPGGQPSISGTHVAWIKASHLYYGKYVIKYK
jgi:hypothetical protein